MQEALTHLLHEVHGGEGATLRVLGRQSPPPPRGHCQTCRL